MIYKFSGTITEVSDIEVVGKNGLRKLTFICRNMDDVIYFTLLGKNIDLFDGFKIYDKVDVDFTISTVPYNDHWFVNIIPNRIRHALSERQKQEQQDKKKERRERRTYRDENGYEQYQREKYDDAKPPPKPPPKSQNYFEGCYNLDDLKRRYRELAKKYHPDAGGDPDIMKEVNVQHDKLKKQYASR